MIDRPDAGAGPLARLAEAAREGRADRGEFLALASVFGASTAAAYGALGLAAPARAQGTPVKGGTLRVAMRVMPLRDPPQLRLCPRWPTSPAGSAERLGRWDAPTSPWRVGSCKAGEVSD
jgi:hypothetical protein